MVLWLTRISPGVSSHTADSTTASKTKGWSDGR